MKLAQKTAIVTGAADGIGLAIAKLFSRAGAHVFLADTNAGKLETEATSLRSSSLLATAVRCDVTSTADVNALVAAAAATGRIDILVNNAAIAIGGRIDKMQESDWERVIDTNLTSAFRTIKAVLPHLLERRAGSVINIGSTQSHRSWPGWSAYAASKGGLASLTVQLAGEFGADFLRFNCISPGAINTPMNERRVATEGNKLLAAWTGMHAIPRLGHPEEVAAAALFLASDDAAFITGQDLLVDGGLTTLPRYIE
jgi:NAD(P)-dependent dehydrogenase (short-subunit alcohol dehydrogenase family)